jgi:hypothetical protein
MPEVKITLLNDSGFINIGSAAENPFYYRSYIISKIPQLLRLDYTAITKQDRSIAKGHH